MTQYMKWDLDQPIEIVGHDNCPLGVHVIDERSVMAVNAALASGRPLLLRGEPGTGKSQLARAAASALRRAFVSFTVDHRTEPRDLLYSVDYTARLALAQVLGVMPREGVPAPEEQIHVRHFTHPGPLWWAFDWEGASVQADISKATIPACAAGCDERHGVVVLIDEVDKADSAVPNGLLEALGDRRFSVPTGETVRMKGDEAPLVVITTNEERALPDAFLRRCIVHHLRLHKDEGQLLAWLERLGAAHFKGVDPGVLRLAATLLIEDRREINARGLAPPGVAEYIDLLAAVTRQETTATAQETLLRRLRDFTYQKHPAESDTP